MRNRFLLALCALSLACAQASFAAGPVPAALDAEARANGSVRVIVQLAPSASRSERRARQDAALAGVDGRARTAARRYQHLDAFALEASARDLQALAASPTVISLALDGPLAAPSLDSTGPLIGATASIAAGYNGSGAAIAILDTGVDRNHAFFAGRIVAEACFSANGNCPNGQTSEIGPGAGDACTFSGACFHGTHVAGIAAGASATYQGVAPGAQLASIRIFSQFTGGSCSGTGYDPCALAWPSDILAGIDHARTLAATLPLAAVNMSFGGGKYFGKSGCEVPNAVEKTALDLMLAAGVAPVAASGNNSWPDAMNAPACISTAIAVGATDDADQVAAFSNSMVLLDFFAPGVTVRSAAPGGATSYASGTSMAAPHVAGAFAVLRQANPSASIATLFAALQSTGIPIVDARPLANNLTRPRIRVDLALKSLAPAACYDGLDNDGDGRFDYPADSDCYSGRDTLEQYIGWGCGVGPELAFALPLLAAACRRRFAARSEP